MLFGNRVKSIPSLSLVSLRACLVWGNEKEKKGKDSKKVSFYCLVKES